MLPHTSFCSRFLHPPRLFDRNRRRRSCGAFTAIELIGVLTIIALIAAAIFPQVIRRIDRAAWQRETSDLAAMANGLVQTIVRDKQIPAQTGIPPAIAKYLDMSPSQVTNTPRRFNRAFLVDPSLSVSNVIPSTLPYNQGATASPTPPVRARMLIVSTLAKALPAIDPVTSFVDIWTTTNGVVPSSLSGWGGKGEDLCVQRIDLVSSFHKLVLINVDTNSNHTGYYQLEANSIQSLEPNGSQITNYVLHGTALNLYAAGNLPSNLQLRVIINRDESFGYQNDHWSGDLAPGDLPETLGEYGTWVAKFLSYPAICPNNHATPQAVVDQFYEYMWSYWVWAGVNFEGINDGTTTVQDPLFRTVSDAQVALADFANNLIH